MTIIIDAGTENELFRVDGSGGSAIKAALAAGVDLSQPFIVRTDTGFAWSTRRYSFPGIPLVEDIDQKTLAALKASGRLDMSTWHGEDHNICGTTHCIAGWAVHHAGEAGYALELAARSLPLVPGSETAHAATWLYLRTYPGRAVPAFYGFSSDSAYAELQARVAATPCHHDMQEQPGTLV